MRTKLAFLSIVFLALLITTNGMLRNQDAKPSSSTDADQAKHSLAINLLRIINTTEVEYIMKHGTYASKDALLKTEEFKRRVEPWATRNNLQLVNGSLSSGPEIMPGWSLRLDVTADGQKYDVLLEDTTDKSCGYAAVTDERGVIRQSKAIDCAI